MGTAITVDLVSGVPFELARQVLAEVVAQEPSRQLRAGLRPMFHHPRQDGDSPTPRIKGELRLPTAQRALLNFAFAARHLREQGMRALELTVRGSLGEADSEFLHAVAALVEVTLHLEPAAALPPPDAAAVDPESRRVLEARDAVVASPPEQRAELWAATLARYMAAGDPWTARWLSEQLLEAGLEPGPMVAAVIATAYLYSDAVHAADAFARIAEQGDPRVRALGLYDRAIMQLRYLPAGLRDRDTVAGLLAEASQVLATAEFTEVASEFVLVQNARALHLLGDAQTGSDGAEACRVLERAIDTVLTHGYSGTTAHAILLNNYGRALDRVFGDEEADAARAALERSVEIEATNPDGWLDLAQFLARREQFDAAARAAHTGLDVVEVFPELWDTLGFCLAQLGRHQDAADAYAGGVRVGGDPAVLGLACARQLLEAGRHDAAAAELADLAVLPRLDGDAHAEIAVLRIAAEQPADPADTVKRFEALAHRFPDSALVAANLAAAHEWQRTTERMTEHTAEHITERTARSTAAGSGDGAGGEAVPQPRAADQAAGR